MRESMLLSTGRICVDNEQSSPISQACDIGEYTPQDDCKGLVRFLLCPS